MATNILNYINGSLVNPLKTYDEIKSLEKAPVFEAFLAVLLVTIISSIYSFSSQHVFLLPFHILFYVSIAIISWVFFAGIINTLNIIFNKFSKFETLLVLTGLSCLPWILLGPAILFKGIGFLGGVISVLLYITISLWSLLLQIIAINKTYELTFGKTILLLLSPFAGVLIVFFWCIGIVSSLIRIFALLI